MADKKFIRSSRFRSICEVIREAYWLTNDPEVRSRLVEASKMAKKMGNKLIEYKFDKKFEEIDRREGLDAYYGMMEYKEVKEHGDVAAERKAQYRKELEEEKKAALMKLEEHPVDVEPKESDS